MAAASPAGRLVLLVALCCCAAQAEEQDPLYGAGEEQGRQPAAPPEPPTGAAAAAAAAEEEYNPTNTAQRAQAAIFIEATVRKDVDIALRTYLRCEACEAIAFQVLLEFSVAEQRSKVKRGQLSEQHVGMSLDEYGACTPENFEQHRLVQLNGTKYVSGIGLMVEDLTDPKPREVPGNLTVPLALRCLDTTVVRTPAELYQAYLENQLEVVLCMPVCRRKERGTKKGRKAKKQEHADYSADEAAYVDYSAELLVLREELRALGGAPTPTDVGARLTAAEAELARLRGLLGMWSTAKYRTSQKITVLSNENLVQCGLMAADARETLGEIETVELEAEGQEEL